MTGIEWFLFIFSLIFLFVFFGKVVNVLSQGKVYGKIFSWAGFSLGIVCFGLCLGLLMIDASLLAALIVNWLKAFLVLLALFQIIEVFYLFPKLLNASVNKRSNDLFASEPFKWWRN